MKTLKKLNKLVVATLILSLFAADLFAVSPKADQAKPILEVVGYIVEQGEKLDGCHIKVFKGNELITTLEVKKSGKFDVSLDRNFHYTIEILKEGYQSKRISISTLMPDDAPDDILEFEFTVDLFKTEKLEGADVFFMDFPFTIVSYNAKLDKFDFDLAYTQNMRAEYKNLLEQANE